MPKKQVRKNKTLYTYVTAENNNWVRKQARKHKTSYSAWLNTRITQMRVQSERKTT